MIQNKKVLCIIPARGGSKGVPGKNIKPLHGKPLIAYSIEHAQKSSYIDRTIISSEDPDIIQTCKNHGADVPFIRPATLATDESSTIDVLVHALKWLQDNQNQSYDLLVLLHATTPLRLSSDIDQSLELLLEKKATSVISVAEAYRNPYFNMVEATEKGTVHLSKKGNFETRQSAPIVYDMNASIYVWDVPSFLKNPKTLTDNTYPYIMPLERSVDIDTPLDFKIAEMLLAQKQ